MKIVVITTDGREKNALVLGYGGAVTISGGAITVGDYSIYGVDTEGGAAADDLDTINGGIQGQILILRMATEGDVVTVKAAGGNIRLSADCVLDAVNDRLMLLRRHGSARWLELSRFA